MEICNPPPSPFRKGGVIKRFKEEEVFLVDEKKRDKEYSFIPHFFKGG